MAGTDLFSVAVCFVIIVTGIEAQGPDDNVLDIDCDMKGLVAGSTATIQEICRGNFQVVVHGLTTNAYMFPTQSFPWKLEMTLVTDATDPDNIIKSTKTVPIEQAELQYSDNITEIVTNYLAVTNGDGPEFQIPAGKCDNRGGKGIMRFYSDQPGFDKEYFGKGFFRVLCDFSGMDIKLDLQTQNGMPYQLVDSFFHVNRVNSTSDLLYGTELSTLQIAVVGSIPTLEPADTCIFAIAYLTKANASYPGPISHYCTEMGMHTHLPEMTFHDILLGVPVCLSNMNNGGDLLQMVRDSNQNLSLCGQYTLTIQLDPMHTLYNEMYKCNNFLTFDIHFNCHTTTGDMTPATCEIMMDPFGGGPDQELFDTRFIYHKAMNNYMDYETVHDIRMFRQTSMDKQSWREMHEDHTGMQSTGLGLLKVFSKYIENQDIQSTCSDLVMESDVENAISELEGLNDDLLKASQDLSIAILVPAYVTAKEKINRLGTTMDYYGIASEVETMMRDMVNPGSNIPFNEHVKAMAAVNAMNATLGLAVALQSGVGEMEINMYAHAQACETVHWLEHVPMIMMSLNDVFNYENQRNGKDMLMKVVGNLTATVLHMHYLYPEFTCIEDVFLNMLSYAEKWTNETPEDRNKIDLDWMFDVDQVRDTNEVGNAKAAFSGCNLKPNQCVKKLRTVCVSNLMRSAMPAMDSKHEICKARYLKQEAKKMSRWVGMKHREKMDSDDNCRYDPMAPRRGPLSLWKMEHERIGHGYGQVIYRGMPTLDNKNIMWQKTSLCTCDQCHDPVKKRKRK